jgi:hypothetical protein
MWTTRKRLPNDERASRHTLHERVSQAAKDLEDRAWRLPPGPERDALLRRSRQMNIADHVNEWLSSAGLRAPN